MQWNALISKYLLSQLSSLKLKALVLYTIYNIQYTIYNILRAKIFLPDQKDYTNYKCTDFSITLFEFVNFVIFGKITK
jgi:hypothetical protein